MTHDNDPKVVKFPGRALAPVEPEPKEALVLVCGACDCSTHYHYGNGAVECANCGQLMDHATTSWRKELPPEPREPQSTKGTIHVRSLPTADFARADVLKKVNTWAKEDELEVLAAYHCDGHGAFWFNIRTQEDKEYAVRKLNEVLASIEKVDPRDG